MFEWGDKKNSGEESTMDDAMVRNNMETTLHVNDYKFHKPRK